MIKICDNLIISTENKEIPSFPIGDDLFYKVHLYVRENNVSEGTHFSILDKKGRVLFGAVYLEDTIAGIKRKDLSDYHIRFRNDAENLDFTFLDRYQKFVFLGVDEYSIAIARLLLEYRPEKKIIFADKRAKYFLGTKRVQYLRYPRDAARYMELTEEWMRGNGGSFWERLKALAGWKILGWLKNKGICCVVKADRRNHPDEDGTVYNSQNIVYSLLWKQRQRSFGEKNADREIVILDYACDDEGLGSIAKCTFAHFMWLTRGGYVPVMNLSKLPNQYLAAEGENMWEYFFEPVTSVSVEEAYQSRHVYVASENDISWCDFHINPYQRTYMKAFENSEEFRRIIRINQETKQHIERKMPKEIRDGKRVLGVVARGTDFRNAAAVKTNKTWRENVVEIDRLIEACCHYKKKYNYDYVYVATEDQEYFDKFKNCFGESLLSISQKRVTYDYENEEFKPVRELLAAKNGKMMGRDYLSGVWSLTECTALLYNVECGAVRLAWQWKQGDYELFQCIDPKLGGNVDE